MYRGKCARSWPGSGGKTGSSRAGGSARPRSRTRGRFSNPAVSWRPSYLRAWVGGHGGDGRLAGGGNRRGCGEKCRPQRAWAEISRVIACRGTTLSTPPSLIASLGMPKTTQLASSCARVRAPASCISNRPRAPSSPIPVMITPSAFLPACLATERKSASTEGRCRLTSGPSLTSTWYWAPLRLSCMCLPPGAISARPASTRSPSSASRTSIWHTLSRRAAKAVVNFSGMCCTTTMPGETRGRAESTTSRAWVPPVDVPIATTRCVVCLKASMLGGAASNVAATRVGGARLAVFARAAARTTSRRLFEASSRNSFIPSLGLVTMAKAPADRACMVVSAPAVVSVEQITTGVGRSLMIFARNVRPSMRGISTSSTTTSGHCICMRCMAKMGSATAAMTLIERSRDSVAVIAWRTTAESSTTITLMRGAALRSPMRARPRDLRRGLAHPHIAAPDVEDHVSVAVASEVLRGELETKLCDRRAPELDVGLGDRRAPVNGTGGPEHPAAPEELHLEFGSPRAGAMDLAHEHLHGVFGIPAVERLAFPPFPARTPGQHVVAHPSDPEPRMPQRDGDARSQQGPDPRPVLAEIEFTRLEEHLEDIRRRLHGVTLR